MTEEPSNPFRVERLYLRDVGPFAELDLRFRPKRTTGKADLHVLVGPNGSGKSTVLYALAGLFSDEGAVPTLALSRLRDAHSLIAAELPYGAIALTRQPEGSSLHVPGVSQALSPQPCWPSASWCEVAGMQPAYHMRGRIQNARAHPSSAQRLDYAAFAYAGQRNLGSYQLVAIREPASSPLANALSFNATADSAAIVQWLANAHTREALALKDGNKADAARYLAARTQVEDAVRAVIGEDVRFVMSYDPLGITLLRNGASLDLDVLPDGVKSIVSWVADLLSRLDRIPWEGNVPVLQRRFLLLLDEVDIHLHPAWQRKVLPMLQGLFPHAQIIVTTHSPFVVASVSDAWVYRFAVKDGAASLAEVTPSQAGHSYGEVLRTTFQVASEFDVETEHALAAFDALRDEVLRGAHDRYDALRAMAIDLGRRGVELHDIVTSELLQVARRIGRAP